MRKLSDYPIGKKTTKSPYGFEYLSGKIRGIMELPEAGIQLANQEVILCLIEKIEELENKVHSLELRVEYKCKKI